MWNLFIERMITEKEELVGKIAKADAYLTDNQGDDLLTAQVHAMMTYASILECRIGSITKDG